jgi:hypothetical protein
MTDTTITMEQILHALHDLGADADAVADTLRARHITGTHNSASCPIANYLKQELQLPPETGAVYAYVHLIQMNMLVNQRTFVVMVTPPNPVREFIRRFDRSFRLFQSAFAYYPDLYQEPS